MCSCRSLISITWSRGELANDPIRLVAQLVDEVVRLREPARDELGRRDLTAVRGRERRHDDEHAVVGEPAPVAERHVLHVPDPQAVDERDSRAHPVDEPRAAAGELDHRAVLGDEDPLLRHARVTRELRMRGEHPVLAVDRHHVARTEQREHRPQLLLTRVTGHVHGSDLLVQHLGPGACELVDRVVDAQLVAGHGLRGDDDGVAGLDGDRLVVAVRDPGQRRHRLTLAPGAEDEHAARPEASRASSGFTIASSGNET